MDLLTTTASFCEDRVGKDSIYGVLHRECHDLFPDEMFGDLFDDVGRASVPPMIVAVVMVLQRFEGASDREAVDKFTFDARWKYAAGGLAFDYPGFVHTVLVNMRARLAVSDRPDRIFETVLEVAKEAGLVGRRRVLDSTALYDAVTTMDTVTLIRSAIRGLLAAADAGLEAQLRERLARDDGYAGAGKPVCDYDDKAAREELVDALARDALALLAFLDGRDDLDEPVDEAARLLATVTGQDLAEDTDGVFRIARKVSKDRVISIVDPDAWHGHKTSARSFDGYKGHVAVDPDSELVTATTVTPGNAGDADAATDLLADDLLASDDATARGHDEPDMADSSGVADDNTDTTIGGDAADDRPAVYGDAAYGAGELLDELEKAAVKAGTKVQPPASQGGRFSKDEFDIDLDNDTVTCPNSVTVPIRKAGGGRRRARFGTVCSDCPLREQCTSSPKGRVVMISPYEEQLARARAEQKTPAWQADYKATRPKVERKIGHLMRRRHGGRRARMRGHTKVTADFSLLAAAVNLARLGVLGLRQGPGKTWIAEAA